MDSGGGYSVDTNASANTDVRAGSGNTANFSFGGINTPAKIPSWVWPVGIGAFLLLGGLYIWRSR